MASAETIAKLGREAARQAQELEREKAARAHAQQEVKDERTMHVGSVAEHVKLLKLTQERHIADVLLLTSVLDGNSATTPRDRA